MHNTIIREQLTKYHGYEVHFKENGFLLAFAMLEDAINFCITIQRIFVSVEWPANLASHPSASTKKNDLGENLWRGLRVRMGINKGSPTYHRDKNTERITYVCEILYLNLIK